jgi:FAD/FMN-containing dehydrogenase
MLSQPIIEQLIAIVGESRLLLGADDLQRFGVDRTTLWQAAPCAVVLPETVEEVQSIVRLANQCNLAIVPSGGKGW